MTTLTKAKLLELGKPKVKLVTDVPVIGEVWIRSCPQVTQSRRDSALIGKDREQFVELRQLYLIIDQVMENETTPMFTEADMEAIGQLDNAIVKRLLDAIAAFNGAEDEGGNDKGG